MTAIQQKSQRRQRRLFAAIAGWALLGAASTGIVACTNAAAQESTTSAPSVATPSTTSTAATSDATISSASAGTSSAATTGSDAPASSSTAEPTTTAAAASTYADGTYTATGSYSSPGGTETISISLTLSDDVITAATAEGEATSGPSSQYQGEFEENFAALIVGKDIDDVSLDKVAGSSLTSGGFNAAVETIKSDALA